MFLFCLIAFSCSSQKHTREETSNDLFNLYKKRMDRLISSNNRCYPKYKDKIITEIIKEDYIFHYKHDTISYKIKVSSKYYSDFLPLFENGLLHPQLMSSHLRTVISVGQFKELSRSINETKRRYKLWIWCEGIMNPCEYTIELLNKNATNQTSTKDFIQNNVTIIYISQCRIIL